MHVRQGRGESQAGYCREEREREGGREGEGGGGGLRDSSGGGRTNPLLLSHKQPKTDGRMFWPAVAANGERGPAPSVRAGPV